MFALPGIVLLIVFILLRPQEFVPALEGLPLLHLALVMAVVGFAVDVLANITRPKPTPMLYWGLAFLGWSILTLVFRAPGDMLGHHSQRLIICVLFGLVVAHGVTTPKGLSIVAGTALFCAIALAAVGVHQGLSPKQCLVAEETGWIPTDGKPDGRLCGNRIDCYENAGRDPASTYLCEHVGLFGTTSIGDGRVRYRGVLKDPNELALAIAAALPIAFAMRREKGGISRSLIALLALLLVLVCTIFTGSRGGQLVVLAVIGTYFIVRTGFRGIIAAGVLAIPALVYGGRGGEVASSSTTERLECWYAGIQMFFGHPILGVGSGRFIEHHYLTAHNTYVLSLAEGGPIGLILFIGLVYSGARVPFTALQRYAKDDDPRRAWAVALLAAMAGMSLGIFFLSFSANHVFWLFIGIVSAFYGVLKDADPGFEVPWRTRDYAAITAIAFGIGSAVFVYTRLALG